MTEQQKLDGRDYISCLPDDILLIILSKLNMREGAITTVLSTRWRNLWTLPSSILRLDASNLIPTNTHYVQQYNKDYQGTAINIKFEDMVDKILRQYSGEVIDQLHISYIPCYYKVNKIIPREPWVQVDTWIEIAKQKSVQTLDLSFERFKSSCYEFRSLKSLTSTTLLSLVTLLLKFPPALSSIQISRFLSSFPNLEELSIVMPNSRLNRLMIEGPSLKLKHLEIIGLAIRFFSISAPNLVSFNFIGYRNIAEVCLENLPLLTQLSYSEFNYCKIQETNWFERSSSTPEFRIILRIPTALTNLKQLNFTLGKAANGGLHSFFSLLEASPCLRKLWLNLGLFTCPLIPNQQFGINQCLEEVEIEGFSGFDNEAQLVMCIAQFSPLLKKIKIHSCLSKLSISKKLEIYTKNYNVNVMSVVQLLQSSLPQLEFLIINEPKKVCKCCLLEPN
ncbi:putative FBD-associated F-box protein At5g56690 [Euphorbia lathyris]|uniref:putative FBD-associated F-box protein At5g56690 n=1 Tax=Euphorbia lathyris TaxID=212925 RepID=UPI0033135858